MCIPRSWRLRGPGQNIYHTNAAAEESQGIDKYTHAHAHSAHSPQRAFKPLSSLHSSIRPSGVRRRETHEMIPDMTDHGAALVEPSDINTFLPDCGQVRRGDLQWFPLAGRGSGWICSADWSCWHWPAVQVRHRNAATWKTGNSGFSAPYFLHSFSPMESLCHVSFSFYTAYWTCLQLNNYRQCFFILVFRDSFWKPARTYGLKLLFNSSLNAFLKDHDYVRKLTL